MATKIGIKKVNLDIPEELHYKIKLQAVKERTLMKNLIIKIISSHFQTEDKEWDNFMKSIENAEVEEPDELDLEISERGRIEIEKGEIEDYEDIKRELGIEDEN